MARLQRALSTISCGVLKAVVRQSLPEVDGAYFMSLVDGGEGGAGTGKWGMSSTPLRMCRYAGADGVAFGEISCQRCCAKHRLGIALYVRARCERPFFFVEN